MEHIRHGEIGLYPAMGCYRLNRDRRKILYFRLSHEIITFNTDQRYVICYNNFKIYILSNDFHPNKNTTSISILSVDIFIFNNIDHTI